MFIKTIVTCRNGLALLHERMGSTGEETAFQQISKNIETMKVVERKGPHDRERLTARTVPGGVKVITSAGIVREGPVLFIDWSYETDPPSVGINPRALPAVPTFLSQHVEFVWRELFSDWTWPAGKDTPPAISNIGHIHNNVCVRLLLNKASLDTWLFQRIPYAARENVLDLAVGVAFVAERESTDPTECLIRGISNWTQRAIHSLEQLQPLGFHVPFVLLGISPKPIESPDVIVLSAEEKPTPLVERVIEVPSQYQQAVIGILSYFSTYLNQLAPALAGESRVRIEQQGDSLRMIVEGNDGARHVVEHAFEEFQSVVRGERTVESLSLSPYATAELRSELRIAQMRIESQQDLILAQGLEIKSLRELSLQLVQRPQAPVHLTISNTAHAIAQARVDVAPLLDEAHALMALLNQADEQASDSISELSEVVGALEDAGNDKSQVNRPLSALKSVLDKALEGGSSLNSALEKIAGGLDTAQRLGAQYNNVAEWCGLPQIPRVFLGQR